jgi:hypothetical protein
VLGSLSALLVIGQLAWAPPVQPDPPPPQPAPTEILPAPAPTYDPNADPNALRQQAFGDTGELPYATEQLQLSEVLQIAIDENIELQNRVVAIEINEAQVLAATGAFDVVITAGLDVSAARTAPRGSAFVFNTGQRFVSANFGVARPLETGGRISLDIAASRTLTDQPLNFANAAASGSSTLAQYQIRPTLTFQHPLLKGMGIKVNRANIDSATR